MNTEPYEGTRRSSSTVLEALAFRVGEEDEAECLEGLIESRRGNDMFGDGDLAVSQVRLFSEACW